MRKLLIILFSLFVCNSFATIRVTLTTYNAVANQCSGNPLITADGTKIDLKKLKNGKIKYAAISRDLLGKIPLGSVIHIEGHGLYEVRDKMNKRFKNHIDILQDISKKNFKKTNIKIVVVKKPNKNNRKC